MAPLEGGSRRAPLPPHLELHLRCASNEFQDSISAVSTLGPEHYTSYHTYGVDWRPGEVRPSGQRARQLPARVLARAACAHPARSCVPTLQYLRWYIDGIFLYEVNAKALAAQTNGTGASVGERLIPLEPMYLLFNLAMSPDFGKVQEDKLPFPAEMKVDWLR